MSKKKTLELKQPSPQYSHYKQLLMSLPFNKKNKIEGWQDVPEADGGEIINDIAKKFNTSTSF